MKRGLLLLCALLLAVLPLQAQRIEIDSVCLVTDVGKVNDGTFNQSAYEGMLRAVAEFNLEFTFVETQSQTDFANNINICIKDGYDIVITVGFALADTMVAAALEHPDLYFIGIDQIIEEPLPNVVGIQFREDQGGFLAGVLAALMTESGIVAGVYGIDIPPVVKFRHGFEQGVRYINPDVVTLGVYIPDFQAPDQGAQAAMQFIGEGVDVIFGAGGPTSSGAILRAAQAGIKVIGVDQDEYYTTFGSGDTPGVENLISSAIKRVDNGVFAMIEAIINGEGFPPDSLYVLEAAIDGISFAPPHDSQVPDDVTEIMNTVLAGLRDGTLETGVDPVTGELLEDLEAVPQSTPEA